MAIGIKGIRFDAVNLTRDDDGRTKVSATYSLISTADRVLAKQEVGGYNGMKIQPSASTEKAFADAVAAYKRDVDMVLGLSEPDTV